MLKQANHMCKEMWSRPGKKANKMRMFSIATHFKYADCLVFVMVRIVRDV